MSIAAVALASSPLGPVIESWRKTTSGFAFNGRTFTLLRLDGSNHGLLTLFFLIVRLEIKREFTVGRLATSRAAALPVVAVGGGMLVLAAWLAVRFGIAVKPAEYSWRQLCRAGALAGCGFTMSLLIAGEAFPGPTAYAAAKIAIFIASLLAGLPGAAVLWPRRAETRSQQAGVWVSRDRGEDPWRTR